VSVPKFRPSLAERVWAAIAENIDRASGWAQLPALTGPPAFMGGLG